MINRKIAMSVLSIGASLALMGSATFAYFSDVASSTANTFASGSLDLDISNTNSNFQENTTATFNVSGIAPGDSRAATIFFHNPGTVDIAEIAMGLTTSMLVNNGDGDIRDVLALRVFPEGTVSDNTCTGGTGEVTAAIDNAVGNNNGTLTFTEFDSDTYDSLPIAVARSGGTGQVCLQVQMLSTADNTYQGDSVQASFVFTGHQVTSQP